jgi:signal transduction histidine kinase
VILQFPGRKGIRVTQLLETDMPESLQFINSSVDRLDRMVNALLTLSRMGHREMSCNVVDLRELVNTVLESQQHQINECNIQIDVGALPKVRIDHLAMEQIIGNLVDNAIKYLDPDRPGKIEIVSTDSGDNYLFAVQDNGRGIAAADCEKIFEIFRRVGKQDKPGDGMGLAYVRTLVRQLGGSIWCESKLGAETKMNFIVPKHPLLSELL